MGTETEIASSLSSESRFVTYVERLVGVIGHADRAKPLFDYCQGLLPCERIVHGARVVSPGKPDQIVTPSQAPPAAIQSAPGVRVP